MTVSIISNTMPSTHPHIIPLTHLQGLVDGVSGVVRKPVEGAKQEGVGGFFKGSYLFICF